MAESTLKNTYWWNQGRFPVLSGALGRLIPAEGKVAEPRKNKALERFRKARNCYYDLYNNGLCNRKKEFRVVFGFASYHNYNKPVSQWLIDRTETTFNEIMLEAGREQGLI